MLDAITWWIPYAILFLVLLLLVVFRQKVAAGATWIYRKFQDPRNRIQKDLEKYQRRALESTLLLTYLVNDEKVLEYVELIIACVSNSRAYAPECNRDRTTLNDLVSRIGHEKTLKEFLTLLLVYRQITLLSESLYHSKYLQSSLNVELLYNELKACNEMIQGISLGKHSPEIILDLVQLA